MNVGNKSTAELVKEEISSNLYLNEVLKKGLINYSALTREILSKIKHKNKKANFSSVLIAIQRYYDEIKVTKSENDCGELLKDCELIMKNKISSFTLERTKNVMNLINKISKTIRWDLGDIMFFVQGSGEITVVIDKKNEKKFSGLGKSILEKKEGLTLLSLREAGESTSYSKDIPGFLSFITGKLAEQEINIIDIASTYKQVIFVLYEKDSTKAYTVLDSLIKHYQ
ncbi:MAG: ACT domain-containing protein [Nanoarchaeota archaeon]|nr:ACT domain-containing protein [Nanoarchaeota archaeon]MBU4086682.1 ACT domain-containing protein [Nanoarchaeota archaeon]